MRLLPWQDAIMSQLNTALGSHIDVLDGGYIDGEDVGHLENGMIAPYVLVWFGGLIAAGPGHEGICGVRQDSKTGFFVLQCVGTSMTHARQLGDECRNTLTGFRPNDEGELYEEGAPAVRNPIDTTTGVDTRYSYPLAFRGIVNTAPA